MKELKYGILSTSSIAPRFITAVREADAGNIVALSSRTLEKAKAKAAEWNIPKAYGSHDELIKDPEVNIVYISTVNSLHYIWAKKALEQGKHVLCEKPCTISSDETKELFEIARRKGVFFMEAQKMLLLPVIQETEKIISSGELGEVCMVDMSHSFSAGYNDWLFNGEFGGGTLLSSGIYAIQLLIKLFGGIKSIGGTCSKKKGCAEWQYVLSGETEKGQLFSIKNSTGTSLSNLAVIYGSKGRIEISDYWKSRKITSYLNGKEPAVIEIPCEYELVYEAKHVRECIENGLLTSPVVTEDISVKGIEALEKVKKEWDLI